MYDYEDIVSWEIRNDNGNVLYSKNPISSESETIEVCLPDGNYVFTIYDKIGNRNHSHGAYKLIIDDNIVKEGANFDYSETTTFTIITPSNMPSLS